MPSNLRNLKYSPKPKTTEKKIMLNKSQLLAKWKPILEHADAPTIGDKNRVEVTAQLLENQELANREQQNILTEAAAVDGSVTGGVATFDPVLVSLVRRAMPSLIAYDVAGVQAMTGPTGLIFAMRARYADGTGTGDSAAASDSDDTVIIDSNDTEALFNEADAEFTGDNSGKGITTASAEGDISPEMGFTIEKVTVTAKTRALKAGYSMELAQDLKAIHGLDAESELANILATEVLAEINREIIGEINNAAKTGALTGASSGTFNLQADADGRWAIEKFQSLIFQIETEANTIGIQARRGKGNWLICSSNVASAIASTGRLDVTSIGTNLEVDAMGNTYAGMLGRMKVYVDPYASAEYATVGYRGSNPWDAGFYYAPYVPLTMVRAVDEVSFQPKIAFKTRYGVAHNPIVAAVTSTGTVAADSNPYFRRFLVTNINDLS